MQNMDTMNAGQPLNLSDNIKDTDIDVVVVERKTHKDRSQAEEVKSVVVSEGIAKE